MRDLRVGVLVIATVVAGAAGSAGADGPIDACVKKKSGAVRIVAAGTTCRKSERAVTWNTQGVAGTPGADGTAVAYAHVVGATAHVDATNSKKVTDAMVSHGLGAGDFCFDLPFTPKSVVVTVDLGSQDTGFATAQLGASAGNCPPTAEASVHVSVGGGSPHGENDDFYVVFN